MDKRVCSHCGSINRSEARFCHICGKPLSHAKTPVRTQDPISTFVESLVREVKSVFNDLSNSIQRKGDIPEKKSYNETPLRIPAPTRLVSDLVKPKPQGGTIGGYVIKEVWALRHSNYYEVHQERCPQGHVNREPTARFCDTCQAELNIYLVHETLMNMPQGDDRKRRHLIELSQTVSPGFLRHVSIFDENGRRYAVCEHPGDGWLCLSQVELPVSDSAKVIDWCMNLGNAMSVLLNHDLAPDFYSLIEYLEPVVVTNNGNVVFADLAVFKRVKEQPAKVDEDETEAAQQKALRYMAQILYILTSGNRQNLRRAPHDYSDVPPIFRGLMRGVVRGDLTGMKSFLAELEEINRLPDSRRGLRQIAGYRTDVGRKRGHNEDFVGKYSLGLQQTPEAAEVGLYLVADGMGGHQAGEVASRDVVKVILEEIQEGIQSLQSVPKLKRGTIKLDVDTTPGDILIRAVQRANEILFNARNKMDSDRGTTLTAALIVGDACAIANVGDSRTYLWREGRLDQITHDHSLVASLVAARMIKPDQAQDHPQRSHIYRNLGERQNVEVDMYECALFPGDRFLLCSDGLWEMVLEQEIQQVMQQSSNPQEACDRLVELANLVCGEDNISTVAVWIA